MYSILRHCYRLTRIISVSEYIITILDIINIDLIKSFIYVIKTHLFAYNRTAVNC